MIKKRADILKGKTYKVNLNCGNIYITVNEDDNGKPFELFIRLGKSGCCIQSHLEAIARLISLCLRENISIKEIIEFLKNINCSEVVVNKGVTYTSCSDTIAKILEKYA